MWRECCAFCSPPVSFVETNKKRMSSARAHVESLLRAKQLDRTLSPTASPARPDRTRPTGIEVLDRALGGGLPHGQLSEVVGPRSSGRAGVACALLAHATRHGDLVALVDAADGFDPVCAHRVGVVLSRVCWVRGWAGTTHVHAVSGATRRAAAPRLTHATKAGARAEQRAADPQRVALDRAVKATHLLLQSGLFAVVVLDCGDIAPRELQRLPFTTWRRLQRGLEGRTTVGVVLAAAGGMRSAGGITVSLRATGRRVRWMGASARSRLFEGLDLHADIGRVHHVPWSGDVTWRLSGIHE